MNYINDVLILSNFAISMPGVTGNSIDIFPISIVISPESIYRLAGKVRNAYFESHLKTSLVFVASLLRQFCAFWAQALSGIRAGFKSAC